MGLNDAKRYISDLMKKQSDPYQWPDFLTGLPDRAAINAKLKEIYPRIEYHCVFYFRIKNIHPYLAKYGTKSHVEIIQWAAAILKTNSDKVGGFVGTINTHDFVAICKKTECEDFELSVRNEFQKKARGFYNETDIKNGAVISFANGSNVHKVGLMSFAYASTIEMDTLPIELVIPTLEKRCTAREKEV